MVKMLEMLDGVRQAKGMTRADLSEKIGMNERALNRIFNGKHTPRPDTIEKLCEALKLSTYPAEWFDSVMEKSNE